MLRGISCGQCKHYYLSEVPNDTCTDKNANNVTTPTQACLTVVDLQPYWTVEEMKRGKERTQL